MLLLLATHLASAADPPEFDGGIYGGGFLSFDSESLPTTPVWGMHGTVQFGDHYGIELAMGALSVVTSGEGVVPKVAIPAFDPRLEFQYYSHDRSHRFRPFGAVAVGVYNEPGRFSPFIDIGPSVEINVLPILDLRADARFRFVTGGNEKAAAPGVLLAVGAQLHNARSRDADGDGITDKNDACVDQPEDIDTYSDTDGCPDPDNDNDGIVDANDGCPIAAEDADGFADGDGCPDVDNDNDGIADGSDACRDVAEDKDGFEDTDGCVDADNDKDGVADTSDQCANVPEVVNGYRDRDGCPDEIPEAVKKFSGKIDGITFDTGKATIRASSNVVLDGAVAVLKDNADVRLEVQGHTDDVGDDAKNLLLSQQRAESVVAYFVAKGIAADRLVARGYGETKPMVPNDSTANRTQNRRVEFVLIQ